MKDVVVGEEGGGGAENEVYGVDSMDPKARKLWWKWVMPHDWCCNGLLH